MGIPATFVCLLLFVVGSICGDEESSALQYSSDNFKEEITKAPHFVKFYAPWCGHCKRLAPTWDELAKKYNVDSEEQKLVIAKVDCTQETALCSDNGVQGYPTLKYFNKDPAQSEKYKGGRDLKTLSDFLDQQLGKKAEEEEVVAQEDAPATEVEKDKEVFVLTEETFNKHTEQGNHFIKFYAPWCGHCKRLAPAWEDLGEAFKQDKDVTIAKVNCVEHREVCSGQEVRGYPTLIWFTGGQKTEKYGGGRDLNSLRGYVESMKAKASEKVQSTEEKIPEKTDDDDKPTKDTEKKDDKPIKDGDVNVLSQNNFDAAIKGGFSFVKFYAPWCGHCKRLIPTWDSLAADFKDDENVQVSKVDCTVEKDLCTKMGIRGYPTLKAYLNGKELQYSGSRDLDTLAGFIKSNYPEDGAGEKKEADEPQVKDEVKVEEPVLVLNAENFEKETEKGTTFIKFFAPWCGHCKRLAPTWEELGKKYTDNKSVKIAKVDCTVSQDLCSKSGVRGYPTLILFRNGKELEQHNGPRDMDSLAKFIDSKGPHDEL